MWELFQVLISIILHIRRGYEKGIILLISNVSIYCLCLSDVCSFIYLFTEQTFTEHLFHAISHGHRKERCEAGMCYYTKKPSPVRSRAWRKERTKSQPRLSNPQLPCRCTVLFATESLWLFVTQQYLTDTVAILERVITTAPLRQGYLSRDVHNVRAWATQLSQGREIQRRRRGCGQRRKHKRESGRHWAQRAIKGKIMYNPIDHERRTFGFHVECCKSHWMLSVRGKVMVYIFKEISLNADTRMQEYQWR